MTRYSLKRRTRKYVKGYDLFDSREIYPTNMGNRIRCCKKAAGVFIRNKITAKIVQPKSVSGENSRNAEETFVSTAKRQEILNKLRQVLKKEHHIYITKHLHY